MKWPAAIVLTLPVELGRFYLNLLDDTSDTFVTLAPNGTNPWSTWDSGTSIPQPASTLNVGPPFVITVVPEPHSVSLVAVAPLSLLVWGRGDVKEARLFATYRPGPHRK